MSPNALDAKAPETATTPKTTSPAPPVATPTTIALTTTPAPKPPAIHS